MSIDSKSVYPLYCAYVDQMRHHLSTISSIAVEEDYNVRRLSATEFMDVWERLREIPGRQDDWLNRFSMGYTADIQSIAGKLRVALARGGPACEAA